MEDISKIIDEQIDKAFAKALQEERDAEEKELAQAKIQQEDPRDSYTVVGVRFRDSGKVYFFDPCDFEFEQGDGVIVETVRGIEFARVTALVSEVPASKVTLPLKPILRKATEEDEETVALYRSKEKEYMEVCQAEIDKCGLDMYLVGCEKGFDGTRITFYFTSEGRVDFRDLVRRLAYVLRSRIELRQIGVRDKAKLLGGVGMCGRVVCCAAHLSSFDPVSIKMAKDQNIALSPTKISGICGRLMCCLKYEQECYEQGRRNMPPTGSEVDTPDGNGIIMENDPLTETSKVKITLPDGTPELRKYKKEELRVLRYNHRKNQQKDDDIPTDGELPQD